ncbi:hypothetical protein TNCV_559091 [Trichonephila clavipes]|nr:hypothetical protein TNCV_559091 [Trichonephila clavipes]
MTKAKSEFWSSPLLTTIRAVVAQWSRYHVGKNRDNSSRRSQWRNGEHLGPPAKSGIGPQVGFYKEKVHGGRQTLGPLEPCPPPAMWGCTLRHWSEEDELDERSGQANVGIRGTNTWNCCNEYHSLSTRMYGSRTYGWFKNAFLVEGHNHFPAKYPRR